MLSPDPSQLSAGPVAAREDGLSRCKRIGVRVSACNLSFVARLRPQPGFFLTVNKSKNDQR